MKISEIFYSIQGEGMLAGVPSVFIRTSGCNLRCTWCDTPYTSWKPEGYQMMYGPMLTEIRRHWCGHVVLTGGEPMILPDIIELTEKIKEIDQHITIETAGTMYQKVICDLMSISPKLSNSTPYDREEGIYAEKHEAAPLSAGSLETIDLGIQLSAKVRDLLSGRCPGSPRDGRRTRRRAGPRSTDAGRHHTREVVNERARWLVEVCKDFGYRYCPRLHIDIWGNKRGV